MKKGRNRGEKSRIGRAGGGGAAWRLDPGPADRMSAHKARPSAFPDNPKRVRVSQRKNSLKDLPYQKRSPKTCYPIAVSGLLSLI